MADAERPSTRARSLLPAILAVAALLLFELVPFVPMAVKTFVPYPRLEEAAYLEGSFDYEGDFHLTRNGAVWPKYFVVNAQGRHAFACGYFGARQACFALPERLKGRPIKLWTSFWYGTIQYEIGGPRSQHSGLDRLDYSYAEGLSLFQDGAYTRPDRARPFMIFLGSGALLVLVHLERRRRRKRSHASPPAG